MSRILSQIVSASLILLIVAALAVAASGSSHRQGPTWDKLSSYTFDQWAEDYNRNYESTTEYNSRKSIFEARLESIKKHNADTTRSYKRGVNQFSDWTREEFLKFNTLTPKQLEDKFRAEHGGVDTAAMTMKATVDAKDLPKMVDYRTWNSPQVLTGIKNQGKCGNCWAWGATESIESYYALLTGQLPVLSAQQITSCNTQMDGCGGGSTRQSYDWVSTNTTGLNEEWVYPFTDFFVIHDRMKYTSPCRNITKEFAPSHWTWWPKAGVSGYVNVDMNNATATMEALATKGPLSIGVASALWMDYEGGILHNNHSVGGYATWDNWGIDHAVQMVGYGHDYDLDQDYWIVKNSWGTEWGELGFIRIHRTKNPADEPCGIYPVTNGTVCGTSSVLAEPAYPLVHTLKKNNTNSN